VNKLGRKTIEAMDLDKLNYSKAKAMRPCLKCDKMVVSTPEWRLCWTCRTTATRNSSEMAYGDAMDYHE